MLPLLLLAAEIATNKPKLGPVEKEHKMVVEAVRGCAESEDDIVVVCSKDRGIAEGFRLPKLDPRFASSLRKSGRGELVDGALGASGAGSCSTVGAGGSTGCAKRDYNAWAQWKRDQKKEAHAYEDAD
jgi:hypothetical protein